MDPAEVASLIEGEPAIGSVPVEPGLMNARKVGKNSPDAASIAGSAIGINTESSEMGARDSSATTSSSTLGGRGLLPAQPDTAFKG